MNASPLQRWQNAFTVQDIIKIVRWSVELIFERFSERLWHGAPRPLIEYLLPWFTYLGEFSSFFSWLFYTAYHIAASLGFNGSTFDNYMHLWLSGWKEPHPCSEFSTLNWSNRWPRQAISPLGIKDFFLVKYSKTVSSGNIRRSRCVGPFDQDP